MPTQTVHLVINPVAGSGSAQEFVKNHVAPLLENAGYEVATVLTESEGDASRIAQEIAAKDEMAVRTVILAGGDGTMHEFIEGIHNSKSESKKAGRWNLIMIPVGTVVEDLLESFDEAELAKLHSLAAFLRHDSEPRALPISLLSMRGPNSTETPKPIPSHVVISTCLHANLLVTAEGLRAEYPGVERFKVAAQENAGKFFSAKVTLRPAASGTVELYDPASGSFRPAEASLEDDFAYFLASATCPRLEPNFVISPLLGRIPQSGSMDILIIRPGRDPRILALLAKAGYDTLQQARAAKDEAVLKAANEAWVPRAWEVVGKAYEDGAHVDLTYTADGGVESKGEGEKVVEMYRCGGFEWTPSHDDDKDAHLVCADGSLMHLPPGGTAVVELETAKPGQGEISLWA